MKKITLVNTAIIASFKITINCFLCSENINITINSMSKANGSSVYYIPYHSQILTYQAPELKFHSFLNERDTKIIKWCCANLKTQHLKTNNSTLLNINRGIVFSPKTFLLQVYSKII